MDWCQYEPALPEHAECYMFVECTVFCTLQRALAASLAVSASYLLCTCIPSMMPTQLAWCGQFVGGGTKPQLHKLSNLPGAL